MSSYSNNNSSSNLIDTDTRLQPSLVIPLSSSQQGSPYSRHNSNITPSTSKNQLPKLNTNSVVFNLPASSLSASNMSPTLSAVQSRHKGLPLDTSNNNTSASSNIFSQNNNSANNIASSISHLSLSTTNNNGYSLKLRNLPSDLSTREANAIFSLSTEFIGVEMFFENGNIALLAKFVTFNEAASVARILDNKQIFGSNYLPIKAEFENINNNSNNSSSNPNNMSSASTAKRHTNLTASRSRFIFNNNSSTDFSSNNNNNNNAHNNTNNNGLSDAVCNPIDGMHTPSATTAGKSLLLLETQQDAREYDELVGSPWATTSPAHNAISCTAPSQQHSQQSSQQQQQHSSSIMLDSHNASNVSLSNHSTTSVNGASSSSIAANSSSLDVNTTGTTTNTTSNVPGSQSTSTVAQPSTPIGGYEWGMGSSVSQDGFFLLNKSSHNSHLHISHMAHHQHLNQHLNHHQPNTGILGLSINTSIAAGNNNGSLVGTPLTATPLTAVPLQTPTTAGPQSSALNPLGSQQQSQSLQQSNGSMLDANTSVGNGSTSVDLSLLARVPLPSNPADQNPPCNTLYVGNLPPDATEAELRALFSPQQGFRRLSFKNKAASNSGQNGNNSGPNTSGSGSGGSHGPMCFVEFEDVAYATKALAELYGSYLPRPSGMNNNKGGIRLSFSKNPLGVRGPGQRRGSSNYAYNNSNSNVMYSQQQQQQQVPLTPLTPHGMLPSQNSTSMHIHQQQQYIPSQQQQTYLGYQQHSHY